MNLTNLHAVFQRLREAGWPETELKELLLTSNVKFSIWAMKEGVAADPSKTEKVTTWPLPNTTKEV